MHIPVRFIVTVFGFTLVSTFLYAQQDSQSESKSIKIERLSDDVKIRLDGMVDDAIWMDIEPISDFVMQVPVEGGEPTEKTDVRLTYDSENLYMAIVMHDSDPSGIKAFQKTRDADVDLEDNFTWFFDTYLDRRNAYLFAITPLGVKADALVSMGQGSSVDRNWDGIWEVATKVGTFGWSAEVKIPFRTLNFDAANDTWGINFRRVIKRKNESVIWTGHKLNQGIDRPQDGGMLTGLIDISQGIGLEATPYVNLKNSKVGNEKTQSSFETGMDVSYNITSNLKASLTINTDFAETEVDDRRINLTRFPLQFPEKRDFFLEGAGIYSYAPRSFVHPYFSRRIGLVNGNPIPISYGGRVLGRVGNLDMAVMHVRTGPEGDQNPEDFSVVRLKQNIGKESTIGMVYTRRSTEDGDLLAEPLQARQTYGADLQLNTSKLFQNKIFQFQAFFAFHNPESPTDNETTIWDRSSRGFRLNFPNRPWFGHCSYREFGLDYDPAVGFNRRNGFRRIEPSIGYSPNFPKSKVIRDITWRATYENLWDLNFLLLTQNLKLILTQIEFESGDEVSFQMIRNYERLESPFDILRNGSILIPAGEYRNWTLNIEASTASFRNVVGTVEFSRGGFWSGNRTIWEVGSIFRPFPGLNLGVSYAHTDVTLDEGSFDTNLIQFEGGYDITPYVSIASILQYDNLSKILGMNHRFRWIIKPGSNIFIVYNQNWMREFGEYRFLDRSNILKVNYTHRF